MAELLSMSTQTNQPHHTACIAEAATTGRLERVDVDGVSRPAQNSLGRAIHPTDEGIQNFWRWFGDSKVVDEHGRPLVVFHGTKRDFDTFNPDAYKANEDVHDLRPSGLDPSTYIGSHFAETSDVADSFARGLYLGKHDESAGHVYPCYLRVTNPAFYDDEFKMRSDILSVSASSASVDYEIEKYAEELDLDVDAVYEKYDKSKSFRARVHEGALSADNDMEEPDDSLAKELGTIFREDLQDAGHDGIRYKNQAEGGYAWAVFSPNQIKSALGNNGKFSPNDHRVIAATIPNKKVNPVKFPRIFYRADDGKGKRIYTGNDKWDKYLFASSSISGASLYGPTLWKFEANPDAKILYEGTQQFKQIARKCTGKHLRLLDTYVCVVEEAKVAGYDAVWFEMQADIGTVIINSSAFTVSQFSQELTASVASVLRAANVPCLYVEAKYSTENSMLRTALSDPEEYGTYVIHEFGPAELYFEYLHENNTDEYKRLVESTGAQDPDDNELFDAIIGGEYTPSEGVVEDFLADTPKQRIEDAIRRYDEGHSQINYSLNNGGKLLPRQTWVGHFCSDASSIAQRGFIFGESDPRSLGLTRHKSDNARHRTSGYNFGFLLNDLRKNFEGGVHHNDMKYGDELVLFQTSGVSAYHYGDNENQVIFWGPHVDWVIPIVRASVSDDDRHSEDDYAVLAKDGTYAFRTYSSVPKSKSYGFSEQKNLEICVAWVIKNVNTYRKSIMWELPKKRIVK